MGVRKELRLVYSNLEETDTIREMMIASANYQDSLDTIEIPEFIVGTDSGGSRKRKRRLDYLSPEEKLLYKKLKNREAAQNSRDKKKAYVTTLETSISQLQEENDALKSKMKALAEENERLKRANARLMEEAKAKVSDVVEGRSSRRSVDGADCLEPAAPADPQQKGAAPSALRLPLHLPLLLWLTSSQTWQTSQTGRTTPPTSRSSRDLQTPSNKRHSPFRGRSQKGVRLKGWWGPRQRCWNPPRLLSLAVF